MSGYKFYLSELPPGRDGVRATLKAMAGLVRKARSNPKVIFAARNLVKHLRQKDFKGEIEAVHNFVRDHIRYVKDPRGVETLTAPEQLLQIRQGDCDDKATLVSALLEVLGHPTRFVAVGFHPDHFSHVFTQTRIGPHWVTLETTEPWPVGKNGPKPVAVMIENI